MKDWPSSSILAKEFLMLIARDRFFNNVKTKVSQDENMDAYIACATFTETDRDRRLDLCKYSEKHVVGCVERIVEQLDNKWCGEEEMIFYTNHNQEIFDINVANYHTKKFAVLAYSDDDRNTLERNRSFVLTYNFCN